VDTSGDVDHYGISRSTHIDGTYTAVTTVDFPENEYVDTTGDISDYYIITEEEADDTVLATHYPIWGEELLLRSSVAYEMRWLMETPVFREIPLFTNDGRTKARTMAWGSWDYFPRPELYISMKATDGDRSALKMIPQRGTTGLDNVGTTADDYPNGLEWYADYNNNIFFVQTDGVTPQAIAWHDEIEINYWFHAVSDREINDAIYLAACGIVSQPGVDNSLVAGPRSIGSLPRRWDFTLLNGAAYILYRRLAMWLNSRYRRLVHLEPGVEGDDSYDPSRILDMAKTYKEAYDEGKELITKEKYPSLAVVSTPEYQLPGSRQRFFRLSFKGE
jgi:hypothetical protein